MKVQKECLFCEKQKFNPFVNILLFIGYVGAFAFVFCPAFIQNSQAKDFEFNFHAIAMIISGLFVILIILATLRTQIRKDGIYIQLFPFHLKYKTFLFDDIDQAYVRKYSPLKEYGGWGIRCGWLKGLGTAYNMRGNIGLQLVLKNGKKVLIGTQKPELIESALKEGLKKD